MTRSFLEYVPRPPAHAVGAVSPPPQRHDEPVAAGQMAALHHEALPSQHTTDRRMIPRLKSMVRLLH